LRDSRGWRDIRAGRIEVIIEGRRGKVDEAYDSSGRGEHDPMQDSGSIITAFRGMLMLSSF
jgi:hypothetical protein